jgi:hypothetical protein
VSGWKKGDGVYSVPALATVTCTGLQAADALFCKFSSSSSGGCESESVVTLVEVP